LPDTTSPGPNGAECSLSTYPSSAVRVEESRRWDPRGPGPGRGPQQIWIPHQTPGSITARAPGPTARGSSVSRLVSRGHAPRHG
jgi:hypothetical protein